MNNNLLALNGRDGEFTDEDLISYDRNYSTHRVGISPQEMVERYNGWAKLGTYEKDLGPGRYNGPRYAADTVQKYFQETKEVKLIDVGAGTGLVGEQLVARGFCNVDALDPSQFMLDLANKKSVYKNCYCDYIGGQEVHIADDVYDGLVVSGGMGEGHIPCKGLAEMIRIVKPGGIIVIVMREEYLSYVEEYVSRLELLMCELVKVGHWEALERKVVPRYSFNKNGVIFVFRVLANGVNVTGCSVLNQD